MPDTEKLDDLFADDAPLQPRGASLMAEDGSPIVLADRREPAPAVTHRAASAAEGLVALADPVHDDAWMNAPATGEPGAVAEAAMWPVGPPNLREGNAAAGMCGACVFFTGATDSLTGSCSRYAGAEVSARELCDSYQSRPKAGFDDQRAAMPRMLEADVAEADAPARRSSRGGGVFGMGNSVYDVGKMAEIVDERDPSVEVDPAQFAHAFGDMAIDPGHAMNTDLDKPVILAARPNGGVALVDGWHRAYHAMTKGEKLQAHVITHHEMESTRIHEAAAAGGACTCWPGYERVPGTGPCEKGSCRKGKAIREAERAEPARDIGQVVEAAVDGALAWAPGASRPLTRRERDRRERERQHRIGKAKDKTGGKPRRKEPPKNSQFESKIKRGTGEKGGQFVSKGNTGNIVNAVQRKLALNPDGKFGTATVSAVRAFQKKNGLAVDGVVGKQTASALLGNKHASKVHVGAIKASQASALASRGKPERR